MATKTACIRNINLGREPSNLETAISTAKVLSIVHPIGIRHKDTPYVYLAASNGKSIHLYRVWHSEDPEVSQGIKSGMEVVLESDIPVIYFQTTIGNYLNIEIPGTWVNIYSLGSGSASRMLDNLVFIHKAAAPAIAYSLLCLYRMITQYRQREGERHTSLEDSGYLAVRTLSAANRAKITKNADSFVELFQEFIHKEISSGSSIEESRETLGNVFTETLKELCDAGLMHESQMRVC